MKHILTFLVTMIIFLTVFAKPNVITTSILKNEIALSKQAIVLKAAIPMSHANSLSAPLKTKLNEIKNFPTHINLGTKDTGGGNGLNNQVLEAYTVNPLELPATKAYLLPIIEKLTTESLKWPSQKGKDYWYSFFKLKTWYIAPVKLKPIPNEVLGISASQNESQQLAVQTAREIWIDSELFDAPDVTEEAKMIRQSKLIAHEYIMSIYFLRFKKLFEICEIFKSNEESCDLKELEDLEKIFPTPENKHLISDNYADIREGTNYFLNLASLVSLPDFFKFLNSKNFDKRLFNDDQFASDKSVIESETFTTMPNSSLQIMLDTARLTNRLPTKCVLAGLKLETECFLNKIHTGQSIFKTLVTSASSEAKEFDLTVPNFILDIKSKKNGDSLFNGKVGLIPNASISTSPLPSQPGDSKKYIVMGALPVLPFERKVGELFRQVYAVAHEKAKSGKYELDAIITIPRVITNINKIENKMQCESIVPTNPEEDILIFHKDTLTIEFLLWVSKILNTDDLCRDL
jgi:hypothetical protein